MQCKTVGHVVSCMQKLFLIADIHTYKHNYAHALMFAYASELLLLSQLRLRKRALNNAGSSTWPYNLFISHYLTENVEYACVVYVCVCLTKLPASTK